MDAFKFRYTVDVGEREYINLGVLRITVELHGAINQHWSTFLSKLPDRIPLYQNQIRQKKVRPGRQKV